MDGALGRQVPALIAVFELAGTAVALQRGTKVVRPDRHPEFRDRAADISIINALVRRTR